MRTSLRPPRPNAHIRQVATFGAVSVATTLLDFGLFNILVLSDALSVVAANTVSYSAGILASYALNKRLTFAGGGRDRRSHEIALFVALNLGGLLLNNAAVAVAALAAGRSPLLLNGAKLAAGAATWLFKFVTFKRWVYPAHPRDGEPDTS